jgi:site-specific DNA recombinase
VYSNIIQAPSFYKVGLYIRLSESDEDKAYESESESIINQRNLLLDYVKSYGFTLIKEYVDDGFTGTNFDRPAFQEMIKDIESGLINCVITKDLSRLGRDYIQCGYYVEQYFPQNKIRYISILDQVDTFLETANNDIAPFKALFNDMTSKDTSKKIRSILKNKKEQGKFIGSKPCYGYMRDTLDKGHLIPDPEVAPIVKKIFNMAYSGIGVSDIVSYLNDNHILSPSMYKNTKSSSRQKVNVWTISSVNKLLKNRMYTGDMVQNVQTKLSYKSQKKIALEKEFWIIVEDTHEPLVSKIIFDAIQNAPSRTRVTHCNREKRLLENLLVCKECGNSLSVLYRKNKNYKDGKYWSVNCNKYARDPRRHLCYPHFFPYDKLEEKIMEAIKNTCQKYLNSLNIKELSEKVISSRLTAKNEKLKEREKLVQEIEELKRKLDSLYDDKFSGIISVESYTRLSSQTEKQISALNLRVYEIDNEDKQIKEDAKEIIKYEDQIKSLLNLDNPNRELIKTLVKEIYIDKDKNIEIKYRFKVLDDIKINYEEIKTKIER